MAKKTSVVRNQLNKMELWELLSDVPQQAKKTFRRKGGFSGTDVSPQWRIRRLTEVLGPMGLGWGYEIEDRWEIANCVFVQLAGWYCLPGTPEEKLKIGSTIGGTELERTPDESYKMAVTDAFGKCFAQIGLAASIYLGEDFSGSKYANESTIEKLNSLIEIKQANTEALLTHYKVKDFSELNEEQAKQACDILEQR
tara:strand:- start:2017 stop:2607 length:591 start_codon:yes stop_codon:yes gene_type:complete